MSHYLKIIFTLSIIISNFHFIIGQSQNPTIYFAYETANFTSDTYKNYLTRDGNNAPAGKLGLDFSINKSISLGGYLNYTRFAKPEPYYTTFISNGIEQQREWFGFQKSNALTLGTKINVKLLPLIIKERDLKVDIYTTAQFALLYNNTNNNPFIKNDLTPEFGVGLGLGYSITKRINIFGEYTIGKFYNDKNTRWTFGLKYTL